ncbi:cell division FtsA domain-containing protein [Neobacillus sp. D3-1R]|uniref:cell division FtsA domain-containing protein n=1 Tax=Neobacillus sp. D3-1R TaxID=3445778 RepID=UPI003FA1287F
MQDNKKIFALDIGTRSVVGIILEEQNGQFQVLDVLIKEHTERAMLDGQIHDVLAVSKVISEIKEQLEKRHGLLTKVCVAAAGRALKTERASYSINIQSKPMMQKQDILHLELSAVQEAQAAVASKQDSHINHHYYCVGYSVLYYRLDGEEIGNLIDQIGEEASVEIISTFLPKVVVESLISALHRSGLEMQALTLEPIAAINVLVPPSMRRLNVALVDIGAGTSDIAITDLGTVIAYGMVPIAGDEITEAVSDSFLLDFPLAESAKRELSLKDSILIKDILGFETEVTKEEVISQISPSIDRLAEAICDEIFRLNNQKSPKAVMLVGGGSQTPELTKKIAAKLQLPENRVAIRGTDAISSLSIPDTIDKGPELVTPIGIAIAAHQAPVQYKTIYVNDQPVRLFEVKKLTVGDCLLASGIKMSKLYGKPGLAKMIRMNGTMITIPGQYGKAPTLELNGTPCSLDDVVQNGDVIKVEKGTDGEITNVTIKDLIDDVPFKQVTINGEVCPIHGKILCNGKIVSIDQEVADRDMIEWKMPETIEELIYSLKKEHLLFHLRPMRLKINGKETSFPQFSGTLYKNGNKTNLESQFDHLDEILIDTGEILTIQKLAELKQYPFEYQIPVKFNEEPIVLKKSLIQVKRNGVTLTEQDFLEDGNEITLEQKTMEPFIFQDLFQFIDLDVPANHTGPYLLLKNGEETTFFDELTPGDELKIVWPQL